MKEQLKIGIVGGSGWLGGAIASALLDAGVVVRETVTLSFRSGKPDDAIDACWTPDNHALIARSDIVILSVRPEDWPALDIEVGGKTLISVMAGISLDALSSRYGTDRVVRALPNAASKVRQSYTPWIAAQGISDEDRANVRTIFRACGVEDEVQSDDDIDYLTGLSGSGPALPALLIDAMMRDAVAHGLSPDIARRAVNTVLRGSARLLEASDASPQDVVRTFLDYRGTTAAALEAMQNAGFQASVAAGLAAGFRKAKELQTAVL